MTVALKFYITDPYDENTPQSFSNVEILSHSWRQEVVKCPCHLPSDYAECWLTKDKYTDAISVNE